MSSLASVGVIISLFVFNAHAVSNTAGTSYAVLNTTNTGSGCNTKGCIMLSSNGVLDNQDHGLFTREITPTASCNSYNSATSVQLNAVDVTPTLISSLTFAPSNTSSLCGTADTWHIFKSSVGTIWAVKLNGSANFPSLISGPGGNIVECNPAWAFDTATGCNPAPPPPIKAPIDFSFNHKQPETFATEINLK